MPVIVRQKPQRKTFSRQKHEPAQIGIPAISQILNSEKSIVNRCFWLIVLSASLGALAYQLSDRILNYLSEPVTTTVALTKNESINLPAFTICPSFQKYKETLELILIYLAVKSDDEKYGVDHRDCPLSHSNYAGLVYSSQLAPNMSMVWPFLNFNKKGIEISEIKHDLKKYNDTNVSMPLKFVTSETDCPWARCLTIHPVNPLQIEGGTSIEISIYPLLLSPILEKYKPCPHSAAIFYEYYLGFHDANIPQKYASIFYHLDVTPGRVDLNRLSIKQFFNKNTRHNPCDADPRKALLKVENCVERKLIKMITCRTPFIRSAVLPPCESLAEFLNVTALLITEFVVKKTNVAECFMLYRRPCHNVVSSALRKSFVRTKNRTFARITIDIDDQFFESVHEEYTYRFSALISDVGGSLGIFIGICVLSIAEIIEQILAKLIDLWRN